LTRSLPILCAASRMKTPDVAFDLRPIRGAATASWRFATLASYWSWRNCTWCHGTSGQGYTVAPRLAGQRPQYVESQIRSFHDHLRNNPFSKQYMWSAVAALGSQGAHDLALYFAAIPPKPASDGDRNLAAKGRTICMEGIPDAISPPATPVMALTRRACVTSPSWRPCLFLPESRVRAVGAGVSFEPPIFDAYRGARARPR
jgi:cytochrome c553